MQSVSARTQVFQLSIAAAVGFSAGSLVQPETVTPAADRESPVLTRGRCFELSPDDAEAVALFLASPGILL